jgi:hypothetical protein
MMMLLRPGNVALQPLDGASGSSGSGDHELALEHHERRWRETSRLLVRRTSERPRALGAHDDPTVVEQWGKPVGDYTRG